MEQEYKVGDKVVISKLTCYDVIGTIVRITKKRGDIVVKRGQVEQTFGSDGIEKGGGDYYYKSHISPLTPEAEKQIQESRTVRKCFRMFAELRGMESLLNAEEAQKIIDVLNDNLRRRGLME